MVRKKETVMDGAVLGEGYLVVGNEKYEVRFFVRRSLHRRPFLSIVFVDKRTGIGKSVKCSMRFLHRFLERELERLKKKR